MADSNNMIAPQGALAMTELFPQTSTMANATLDKSDEYVGLTDFTTGLADTFVATYKGQVDCKLASAVQACSIATTTGLQLEAAKVGKEEAMLEEEKHSPITSNV